MPRVASASYEAPEYGCSRPDPTRERAGHAPGGGGRESSHRAHRRIARIRPHRAWCYVARNDEGISAKVSLHPAEQDFIGERPTPRGKPLGASKRLRHRTAGCRCTGACSMPRSDVVCAVLWVSRPGRSDCRQRFAWHPWQLATRSRRLSERAAGSLKARQMRARHGGGAKRETPALATSVNPAARPRERQLIKP